MITAAVLVLVWVADAIGFFMMITYQIPWSLLVKSTLLKTWIKHGEDEILTSLNLTPISLDGHKEKTSPEPKRRKINTVGARCITYGSNITFTLIKL